MPPRSTPMTRWALDARPSPAPAPRGRAALRRCLTPLAAAGSPGPCHSYCPSAALRATPEKRASVEGQRRGSHSRGYHTRPDGGRRKALPGLQGRQGRGKGAHRTPPGTPAEGRDDAPEASRSPALAPPDRASPFSCSACCSSSGSSLAISRFRSGVEEANARLPKTAESSLAPQDGMLGLEAVADPAAGHRRRQDGRPLRREPVGLDPASSEPTRAGTGWPTSRSRATSAWTSPATAPTRSTRRSSSEGRRSRSRRSTRSRVCSRTTSCWSTSSNFRAVIDALGGVEIDVPKPILSNKFDCPYASDARCEQWEGLAVRPGQADDGRPARADLLRASAKPARRSERSHARRPPAGRGRGDDGRACRPDVRAHFRSSAATSSSRSRPTSRPASCSSSVGSTSRERRPWRSTAGSAASLSRSTVSRS